MFGQITKITHQISCPSSYSTRQRIQRQPHDGPRNDGAAGHDGLQAFPYLRHAIWATVLTSPIPGWVRQDLDQARPGQAERTTAVVLQAEGQLTIHKIERIWQNGCQNNSLPMWLMLAHKPLLSSKLSTWNCMACTFAELIFLLFGWKHGHLIG